MIDAMEPRIRRALARAFGERAASAARLQNLGGHASLRIYWRVTLPAGEWPREESTRMAMVLPAGADPSSSEEAGGAGASGELAFVDVHRLLSALEMPVPAIDLWDKAEGVMILEDLGDETFEAAYRRLARDFGHDPGALRVPTEQLYHRALDLVVDMQRALKLASYKEVALPDSIALGRSFDRELLLWECHHYVEWGLEARYGAESIAEAKGDFARCFAALVDDLVALDETLVLRDFQSRNLMLKGGEFHLIDFQDALCGPYVYDLVSLLRDSYIELPYVTVHRLLEHYARQGRAAGLDWCDEEDALERAFNLQTVQRKLKDAGRFVYIDKVKQNDAFLQYYALSIAYVAQALEVLPEHAELADLLAEFEPAWHDGA